MQVKLMNVITSYTPLSTNVVRLIAIQIYVVFTSVGLQTMYNVIYLGVFRFINMGLATIFITLVMNPSIQ